MRYQTLGTTGMQVSRYCLGSMMFGGMRGNPDHADCTRIIHAALDAGINFVDTADVYSHGESEEIVGGALKGRRDDVILATKVHHSMGPDPNMQGSSRRWIMREVEASLKRLQTDWIDLYQLHRPDPSTRIEETLSAMSDLVHQGKVRVIGTSTFPAEEIVEYHWAAERSGFQHFSCEQSPYSIFVRAIERSVLPTCAKYGMGVITNSPLNRAWLAGVYRRLEDIDLTKRPAMDNPRRFDPSLPGPRRKIELLEQLVAIADDAGLPLNHMAMAFVTNHPAVTAAIIGPTRMSDLEAYLAGAGVELDDETLDRIDAVVPPGTLVTEVDAGYDPPSITTPSLRRRPPGARAAG